MSEQEVPFDITTLFEGEFSEELLEVIQELIDDIFEFSEQISDEE